MAAAVAAFQANLCHLAGSKDLPQGSTCQSPAACRYKAPCMSLAAMVLKIIPGIESQAKASCSLWPG